MTGVRTYLKRIIYIIVILLLTGGMPSCIDFGPIPEEEFSYTIPEGVFMVCEGNFMYGNATLSFYLPSTGELQNEVFARANGMKLGDVAQSMTMHDGMGYIVINNSGVIFGIDPDTFKVKKVIKGVSSPRYMHFAGRKAYVTSLYEPRIAVLDLESGKVTGYIDTGVHTSTEQMVQCGDFLFVTCWSYDDTLLVIDTRTDDIVREIKLRSQPRWIVSDAAQKLWVLTDGASGNGETSVAPALYRIDSKTFNIEQEFVFRKGDSPKYLCVDGEGNTIYFLNESVWRMDKDAEELPEDPFIKSSGTIYFTLGVDPVTSDIYLGDAVDYQQQGVVYRFTDKGECVDTLRVGIIPSSFCFKQ